MKNECSIIRDLLPLYTENMVGNDTAAFVEEHLKSCEACRKEWEEAKEPKPIQRSDNAAPLRTLNRKIKIRRIQTIALTAVFVAALIVSAFAVLDAPVYLPYSEGLVTLEKHGDLGILLNFDENVTDFDYNVYDAPDDNSLCYCDIQAWTTLWDQWSSQGNKTRSATVISKGKPMLISYVPNDGSENIFLAKYDPYAEDQLETDVEIEHAITLPRLTLGYYLIFATAALAVMMIVWFILRKEKKLRIWVERISLYPAAYIVSHCIVSGINWTTYSLPRDFSFIIFLSVLLYSGLLLAHNIWYLKKEVKESNLSI